ncbi:MAG: PD-(D/E)XK nuclease family protein [Fimbriimonadaceae bacterium]|nr:PD-(D/E)XK nuclease family protein [Fimbriimonadaceae bacterium]
MARKDTLSPSKITTYLACPTKYYWTYVNPKGKWYLRSKSYFSFGTSLHNVLQRFHDSGDHGVTTTEEAVAALEESWIEAGYSSQDEMMQQLAEGKAIVEAHVERVMREPITAQTIVVEKLYRRDLGPFVLIGRVDRIDEHEDGTIEIIDYKSGREGVTEEEVKNDLAMSSYQLILREHFTDRKIVASIIALRSNTKATAHLDEAEMAEFQQMLTELGNQILNRDWNNEEPVPKALCPTCDFKALCSQHPGFELPTTAE